MRPLTSALDSAFFGASARLGEPFFLACLPEDAAAAASRALTTLGSGREKLNELLADASFVKVPQRLPAAVSTDMDGAFARSSASLADTTPSPSVAAGAAIGVAAGAAVEEDPWISQPKMRCFAAA